MSKHFYYEHAFDHDIKILLPTVVQAELMSIPKRKKNFEYRELIDEYIRFSRDTGSIIPMTQDIMELASDVRVEWREKAGKKLPLPDSIIGATAVKEKATLFSNNNKNNLLPFLSIFSF